MWSCGKHAPAPSQLDAGEGLARGDRVVVEQTAAEFFEGRVLAVDGGRLRVQASAGGDSQSVAESDVYRLPPTAHVWAIGALGICAHADGWLACRVEKTGVPLGVRSAAGEAFTVGADQIVGPSPLTELNLKRYFARRANQLDFLQGAARAGEPRLDPNWRPSVHERVLAKVGNDWFTAHVKELDKDGVVVTLSLPQQVALVPSASLAPEPPSMFSADVHRGDFVLIRPETSSEPWAKRAVRAVSPTEIKLADADGTGKTVSPRDVVPLGP